MKLPTNNVFSWDLRDDRVTRKNNIPVRIIGMVFIVSGDKIYGVSGNRLQFLYDL